MSCRPAILVVLLGGLLEAACAYNLWTEADYNAMDQDSTLLLRVAGPLFPEPPRLTPPFLLFVF